MNLPNDGAAFNAVGIPFSGNVPLRSYSGNIVGAAYSGNSTVRASLLPGELVTRRPRVPDVHDTLTGPGAFSPRPGGASIYRRSDEMPNGVTVILEALFGQR